MGRGKSQVTIVKQQINEAMKTAEIIRLASEKVEQKIHEGKSLLDSARQHIGKMIDRADPLEVAAVVGTTYLIHELIITIPSLTAIVEDKLQLVERDLKNVVTGTPTPLSFLSGIFGLMSNAPIPIVGSFGNDFLRTASNELLKKELVEAQNSQAANPSLETTKRISELLNQLENPTNSTSDALAQALGNPLVWVISFVLAFFLVRQGAQFLKEAGGMQGAISLLLAVV
jgi:hypothetical protein